MRVQVYSSTYQVEGTVWCFVWTSAHPTQGQGYLYRTPGGDVVADSTNSRPMGLVVPSPSSPFVLDTTRTTSCFLYIHTASTTLTIQYNGDNSSNG